MATDMIVKVPKDFLDAFPVTTSRKVIREGRSEFVGWSDLEKVEIMNSRVFSAFDLQTFLSILFAFTQEKVFDREWATQEGHFIPTKATTCQWSTFVKWYRKRELYRGPEIFESIKNIAGVTFVLSWKSKAKEIRRPLWHAALYYYVDGKYNEVDQLRGRGRYAKRLSIGFTIDGDFWEACQKGFHINIAPVLDLSNPMAILLGVWIQGQKYTAIREDRLMQFVFRDLPSRAAYKRKGIFKAFDLLKRVGLITDWYHDKEFGYHKYFWQKPEKFTYNPDWKYPPPEASDLYSLIS